MSGRHASQQWESNHTPRAILTEHNAAVKALSWAPFQRSLLASGGGTAGASGQAVFVLEVGQCSKPTPTRRNETHAMSCHVCFVEPTLHQIGASSSGTSIRRPAPTVLTQGRKSALSCGKGHAPPPKATQLNPQASLTCALPMTPMSFSQVSSPEGVGQLPRFSKNELCLWK